MACRPINLVEGVMTDKPRSTGHKDWWGADIYDLDLMFNPAFGDLWLVEMVDGEWNVTLTHDGLQEDISIAHGFIRCGSLWEISNRPQSKYPE